MVSEIIYITCSTSDQKIEHSHFELDSFPYLNNKTIATESKL